MHYSRVAATMTIDQQHAAILGCCADLCAALESTSAADQIGMIRMRLAGLLHANLTAEETEIMAPIRRLPVASRPRQFIALTTQAAELRLRYSAHVVRWPLAAVANNLEGYKQEALMLVRSVENHLKLKKAVLPEWRRAVA